MKYPVFSNSIKREKESCLVHRGLGRVEFFDFTSELLVNLNTLLMSQVLEGRKRFSFHAPILRPEYFPYPGTAAFFLSEDLEKRELSFRLLGHTLEYAKYCGAEYVVCHLTFNLTDVKEPKTAETLARRACCRIAGMSRGAGVPIDIEFSAYSHSFHRADTFVEIVGRYPELGICVDIGHVYRGALRRKRDYLDDIAQLAQKARSMHLWNTRGFSVNSRFGHMPLHPSQSPEDGWIDVEGALTITLEKNPQVNIIFEYPVAMVNSKIQEGYDWISAIVDRFRNKGGHTPPATQRRR